MNSVPEKDWKKLRKMQKEVTSIACNQILEKAEKLIKDRKGKEHETYLDLWYLIQEENKKIAEMFDDPSRSNAINKLASWKYFEVLSDENLAQFTEETQDEIKVLNKLLKKWKK